MAKRPMADSGHERALADVAQLLGYGSGFKEKQEEAIWSILSGKDTFVSLPTGYGKSLIYAALPLIFDRVLDRRGSIVVCVSPLSCPDSIIVRFAIFAFSGVHYRGNCILMSPNFRGAQNKTAMES